MNKSHVNLHGYCGCGQNIHNFRIINVGDFFELISQNFVFMLF